MAGLCKPHAAAKLVKALREEIGMPIHFHTHDTGGVQAAAILNAAEAGLDIADAAIASMSGGTSQPNLNTLVEGLRNTPREGSLDGAVLDAISEYWREAREFYTPFESPVLAAGSTSISTRCPAGSTRISSSRPRHWACRRAGPKCAGFTPTSISCSATS